MRALALHAGLLGLLAIVIAVGLARGGSFALERELAAVRAIGWAACVALALAICASPFGRAFTRLRKRSFDVAPLRRALGIAAALFATVHGAVAVVTYFGSNLDPVLEMPGMRAGFLASAVLIALWVTSYPSAVRFLRVRSWKPLHRLAYVAAPLAVLHALQGSDPAIFVLLVGSAAVLVIAVLGRLKR